MAATLVGAVLGHSLFKLLPDAVLDGVAAIGFGAILRLSTHSHTPAPSGLVDRAAAAGAFVVGVALVAAMRMPGDILRQMQAAEPSLLQAGLELFIDTAPAVLVGIAAAPATQPSSPHPLPACSCRCAFSAWISRSRACWRF
jgi:hypothetical protein